MLQALWSRKQEQTQQEWYLIVIRPMQSTLTENAKPFLCSKWMNLCKWPLFGCSQTSLHLCPYPASGLVTPLPDQKSERPGCSPGLINKKECKRKSNNWMILSHVIYTQRKYMRHLSLLYFLPRAMTATILTSPTALCLKLITPFKSCVAQDDCREFASQRHL